MRWRWRQSWTSCVRWWRQQIETKWSCSTSWRRRRGGWSDFTCSLLMTRTVDTSHVSLSKTWSGSCFWRKTLCSSLFDRKVEDLQFRVEEACITKGDLEVTRGYITCFSIKHLLSVLPAINLPLVRLMLSLWYSFVNYWQTRWLFYITQGFCRPQVSKCLKFQGPEF